MGQVILRKQFSAIIYPRLFLLLRLYSSINKLSVERKKKEKMLQCVLARSSFAKEERAFYIQDLRVVVVEDHARVSALFSGIFSRRAVESNPLFFSRERQVEEVVALRRSVFQGPILSGCKPRGLCAQGPTLFRIPRP